MFEPYTDHTGKTYNSFSAMCRAWGWYNSKRVRTRLNQGWSLKRALTERAPYGVGMRKNGTSRSCEVFSEFQRDSRCLLREHKAKSLQDLYENFV